MKKNYYEILEIDNNASYEEIKKKYKELVRKYHPDVCKDKDATERITEINVAYDILSNESKRKRYDESLKNNVSFDETEQSEEPFNYEEEIKNCTEREKEFAARIAIEKVIKEELDKVNDILDARLEVIKSSVTVENIIEDYYFDQVEKWWQLVDGYLNNLDSLRIEAETNNINYLITEINNATNTLHDEMQGMPLTILDAQNYLANNDNKIKVLAQISKDLKYISSLIKRDNVELYNQIISGYIDETNYDKYREIKTNEIENAMKKIDSMKKLAELYNLHKKKEINSLDNYQKKLKHNNKKIPKTYEDAKRKAEHHVFYKEREALTDEIVEIIRELRNMRTKMLSGIGNIVTLSEMNDITRRHSKALRKLEDLERLQEKYNIRPENLNILRMTSSMASKEYFETKIQRYAHIEEFFKEYSNSCKRQNIKDLLLHDNVPITGFCLANGVLATLNIICKNYINISIPTTIILTGINVHNLKGKYEIYKHNYKKGTMIINNDEDTKREYKEYCLKNNIKRKTP